MEEKRKGELAWRLLKYKFFVEGIRIKNLKEAIGNISTDTGISKQELEDLFKEALRELAEEM